MQACPPQASIRQPRMQARPHRTRIFFLPMRARPHRAYIYACTRASCTIGLASRRDECEPDPPRLASLHTDASPGCRACVRLKLMQADRYAACIYSRDASLGVQGSHRPESDASLGGSGSHCLESGASLGGSGLHRPESDASLGGSGSRPDLCVAALPSVF
jgi:hypothetical protein